MKKKALEQALKERGDRTRSHTSAVVNHRIDRRTRAAVEACVREGKSAIEKRMGELDREWDVDRAVMLNFSVVGGLLLATGIRRFAKVPPFQPRPKGLLYLFGAQIGFLALHSVVGWCPPVPLLRRLGIRTKQEIETERQLLLQAADDSKPTARNAQSRRRRPRAPSAASAPSTPQSRE